MINWNRVIEVTIIAATNWVALAPFIVENTAEFRATYNF